MRPHIVLWLIDDQGWSNIGYNNPDVHTPTMDKLSSLHGFRLTRQYSHSWCTPSRASLMTGRLPHHVLEKDSGGGSFETLSGLSQKPTLLPQKLKRAGYRTAFVGKWDLGGDSIAQLPSSRGFDVSHGFMSARAIHYYSHRANTPECGSEQAIDWRAGAEAWNGGPQGEIYSMDLFADRIVDEIGTHATEHMGRPFFLYAALQAMHEGCKDEKSSFTDFDSGWYERFGANYSGLDPNVVRANGLATHADMVLNQTYAALVQHGMWGSTLLVHLSDNGGDYASMITDRDPNGFFQAAGNNFPLRGGKKSAFEGGVRVPAFVTGGMVPEKRRGRQLSGYVHLADWFTTLVKLGGGDPHDDVPGFPSPDGMDMWGWLSGKDAASPRTSMLLGLVLRGKQAEAPKVPQHGGHVFEQATLINGSLKLILGEQQCFNGGWMTADGVSPSECDTDTQRWLFDIQADPEERQNLAETHSWALQAMTRLLMEHVSTQTQFFRTPPAGFNVSAACSSYIAANDGHIGPFMEPETAQVSEFLGPPPSVVLSNSNDGSCCQWQGCAQPSTTLLDPDASCCISCGRAVRHGA